jgi:hypothetical protein
MTATMPRTTADKIYTNTIEELRGFIDSHKNEAHGMTGDTSQISAFCRAYSIDRSNLTKCINGQREMSVGLYQRVAVALGILSADQACNEQMLLNVPLRMYLMMNHDAIKNSIMMLNFNA